MGHTKYNKDIVSIIDKMRWFANIQRCILEYEQSYHIGYNGGNIMLIFKYIPDAYYNFRNLSSLHYSYLLIYNKGNSTLSKIPKKY